MSKEMVGAPESEAQLGATASGEIDAKVAGAPVKLKWNVAGTGIWAGALISGGAMLYELNWRSPTSDPAQFMATLFLTLVCGILIGAGVSRGRLSDALREKAEMRQEMKRMAEEKGAIYDRVLSGRLTSGEEQAKKKKK